MSDNRMNDDGIKALAPILQEMHGLVELDIGRKNMLVSAFEVHHSCNRAQHHAIGSSLCLNVCRQCCFETNFSNHDRATP